MPEPRSICLPCEECGTPVSHPVDGDTEAHAEVVRWLTRETTELCATCRAMPNA